MKKFSLRLSMVALAVLSLASFASADEPHDAGFKARGLKDASNVRNYSYSTPAPVTGRRSYSYAPSSQAVEAAPAPIAQQQVGSYRSYSYAPVQNNYRSYRGYNGHTGIGGDYASKATLYK